MAIEWEEAIRVGRKLVVQGPSIPGGTRDATEVDLFAAGYIRSSHTIESAQISATLTDARLRRVAQILIEEIGAEGAGSAEATASRAAVEIRRLRNEVQRLKAAHALSHPAAGLAAAAPAPGGAAVPAEVWCNGYGETCNGYGETTLYPLSAWESLSKAKASIATTSVSPVIHAEHYIHVSVVAAREKSVRYEERQRCVEWVVNRIQELRL